MNNFFSLPRFLLLMRKTVLERPLQIFGLIVLNMIVVALLYTLLKKFLGWNAAQNLTFIWGFLFGGCYLSSSMFNYFSNNASGSSYLTLPASHFEKWLSAILITWVLYVFTFLLFYYVLDHLFVSYYHSHLNPHDPDFKRKLEFIQPLQLNGIMALKTYIMFTNFSAAMFVGALYFNKISFIKTALVVCAILIGAYSLNLLVANSLFDHVSDAFPLSHVAMDVAKKLPDADVGVMIRPGFDEAAVELPPSYSKFSDIGFKYAIPLILCATAFFRLREKEF